MIRIAFIVHGMQAGGIERSVTRIINGLDRSRFDPMVVCLDKSGPAAGWLPDDISVIEIKKRSGNDLASIRRLASVLREHKIDLVQSHNWGTLIETVAARKLARVPAHIHAERGTVMGQVTGGDWKYRLRAIAMRTALTTVNRVMSNAHAVAARVEAGCGYPAAKIAIIPNGVPGFSRTGRTGARRKIRQILGLPANATLIGSVGRLHEVKGFDVLIKAMVDVRDSVHLVIVGEGDQRELLKSISEHEKVCDRVHLVGHHDDVASWLLAMDGYVNSSRSEGMSQSIVEAMSIGLPIIATDVGDAKRMLRCKGLVCGEICSPEDPMALTNAISEVINNKDLCFHYSAASVECHRQFYSESMFIESFQSLYADTLGLSSASTDLKLSVTGDTVADTQSSFSICSSRQGSAQSERSHKMTSNHDDAGLSKI